MDADNHPNNGWRCKSWMVRDPAVTDTTRDQIIRRQIEVRNNDKRGSNLAFVAAGPFSSPYSFVLENVQPRRHVDTWYWQNKQAVATITKLEEDVESHHQLLAFCHSETENATITYRVEVPLGIKVDKRSGKLSFYSPYSMLPQLPQVALTLWLIRRRWMEAESRFTNDSNGFLHRIIETWRRMPTTTATCRT